jgi:hypothetical protein
MLRDGNPDSEGGVMPYPNEHAARLRRPGDFVRIRQLWARKGIRALGGPLKSDPGGGAKIQALRFNKDKWSVTEAKKWLREHDYKPILFEPASEKGMSAYASKTVYRDCEGPLGFPMASHVAKFVEDAMKKLPQECKELISDGIMRRSKAAKIDPQLEDRTEVSAITMDTVDRDFEVVLPKGLDFKQWAKNPVVTFNHLYSELPAGRGLWARQEKRGGAVRGYVAKTQYLNRPQGWEGQWMADAYWHYVKEGYLPGKSIGFIPLEVRPPAEKEIRDRPELAGVKRVISKAMILEYALATVQSNPDAILQSTAKCPGHVCDALGLVITEIPEPPKKIVRTEGDMRRALTAQLLRRVKGQ